MSNVLGTRFPLACLSLAAATSASVLADDAHACGGCFTDTAARESTVVTSHRMALSISPTQTVLWDQIEYAGAPEDFAWVLPVKPGARLELASDAWFETLDAATTVRVASPRTQCASMGGGFDDGGSSGCSMGCSADEAGDGGGDFSESGDQGNVEPPVTVVHEGTVGPYETVTLHASEEGALTGWLVEHGFGIDPDIQPVIDAYSTEGFDFIALRLAPSAGVQQMKPVRVVSAGAVPTLPLRMVAAGTGAEVAISLFVVGEGRWAPENFPSAIVDPELLVWDFAASSSNYSELRGQAFGQAAGRTWLTTSALAGSLLGAVSLPARPGSPLQLAYQVGGDVFPTIAQAYFSQGQDTGETDANAGLCAQAALAHASSTAIVVDNCILEPDGGGGSGGGEETCTPVGPTEIEARDFACGALDDLAVALTGLHPADVWVTRLDANLPRYALADDLVLQAGEQVEVLHFHVPTQAINNNCPLAPAGAVADARGGDGPPTHRRSSRWAILFGIALAAALTVARRATRMRPVFA